MKLKYLVPIIIFVEIIKICIFSFICMLSLMYLSSPVNEVLKVDRIGKYTVCLYTSKTPSFATDIDYIVIGEGHIKNVIENGTVLYQTNLTTNFEVEKNKKEITIFINKKNNLNNKIIDHYKNIKINTKI